MAALLRYGVETTGSLQRDLRDVGLRHPAAHTGSRAGRNPVEVARCQQALLRGTIEHVVAGVVDRQRHALCPESGSSETGFVRIVVRDADIERLALPYSAG
ncbi:hypothetical protein MSAR_26950 [Mycolicibacterium sarraceniae]|uniref:Uncharacterized protein n=1 Tax=Mycolicibacterium sarraceniae TaxID=1534348 RepID=A0A7I7STQ5_9MYCO|nr:hypothetical protein MSAR_26950 [Mycolicibacterium sarraceniae]